MRKSLALYIAILVGSPWATLPQDDYHNYLILLVHGLGSDTNVIGGKNGAKAYPKHTGWLETSTYFEKPEYQSVVGEPSQNSEDFYGGLFEFLTDTLGIDSSNVRYYEMSRACAAFYNEKPGMATLSRELGDRDYDNPGAARWPRQMSNGYRLRFGFDRNPETQKGLSWMQQALVDWERTWRSRHAGFPAESALPDSVIPKKYILIGHSMGGLTIRSYLASSFYQNDVERIITIASPASGTEIVSYINEWSRRGERALENDWNQKYIAKTFVEATAMFLAKEIGSFENVQSRAEKALHQRLNTETWMSDNLHAQSMCADYTNCSFRDWPLGSWMANFGKPGAETSMSWFLTQRLAIFALKDGLTSSLLQNEAGHNWANERGVQQLEPLANNPTNAISKLNEFRFSDSFKYIPKVRVSAIEDLPSPSEQNDLSKWGEALEECWTVFSLFFPEYAETVLGQIMGNGAIYAVQSGSDPWSFATTQAVLNKYTSMIGFYLSQGGDFLVPAYSGQAWKDKSKQDRIELMKQADFRYSRIPYDNVAPIGEMYESAAAASLALKELAELGLLPSAWVQFYGDVFIGLGTGLAVLQYEPDLKVWLGAHGQAIGYSADRRPIRVNSVGQSIIESQLWDMPSVSITAIRKVDSLGHAADMLHDTMIWSKRFSVSNRYGTWKEDVFKNFLTFRKRDSQGNRDYAFLHDIDLRESPDTMRFVAEDFQVDSLKAILVSVNYGPWKSVRLRGDSLNPDSSLNLDRTGYRNTFFMTKADLDLKEGENDLRINIINRYGLGYEQHANIRMFTTSTTFQPAWPLDNVGITGGRTPVDFTTWPVYREQTDHVSWHAVIIGRDSGNKIDSMVLGQNLFLVDPLPADSVSQKPPGYRIHSISDIDFSHFKVPGKEREVLLRVTVTGYTASNVSMGSYSENLHLVLDDLPPTLRWLNATRDTIKISRSMLDTNRFVASFQDNASQLQDIRAYAISSTGQSILVDSTPVVASGAVRTIHWDLNWNGQATPDGVYKLVLQGRDPSYRNPAEYKAWEAHVDSGKPLLSAVYDPSMLNLSKATLVLDLRNTVPVVANVIPSGTAPRFDGTGDQGQVRIATALAKSTSNIDLEYEFSRQRGGASTGFDTLLRGGRSDSAGKDTLILDWNGKGVPVADGIWSLRVRGSDAWGNVGAYTNWNGTLAIDHTAPVLRTHGPDVHTVVPSQALSATFEASEPNDRPELRSIRDLVLSVRLLDGAGASVRSAIISNSWTDSELSASAQMELTGLAAGGYTWEVRAVDRFGNAAVDSRSIVIEHLPTEITSPAENAAVDGPFSLWGSADDPALNDHPFQDYQVDCSTDNGSTWSGACASVPDGTGNTSSRTVDHGVLAWIAPPIHATTLQVRLTSTDGLVAAQSVRILTVASGAVPTPFLSIPDTLRMSQASGDSLVRPVSLAWGLQDLTAADSASPWTARMEWVDSAGQVRHRQSLDGIRFSSLYGAPSNAPDSSGVYVFQERGAIYRVRVVTKSTRDTVTFQVMGMGGIRPAAGSWRQGVDWTGVDASVDDGQNLFAFSAAGRAGVWEFRLELLGTQGIFLGQKLVFADRTPWRAFSGSGYRSLNDSLHPAPVFAGAACKLIGTGSWDVGNAASPWVFDAHPVVGRGLIPDGLYTVRVRATRQSASMVQTWGNFEKQVLLIKSVPLLESVSADPKRIFPLGNPIQPSPQKTNWSVVSTQPSRIRASVVDSNGREVWILALDTSIPAGIHAWAWSGQDGSPGTVGMAPIGTYRLHLHAVSLRVDGSTDPTNQIDTFTASVVLGQDSWAPSSSEALAIRLPGAQSVGAQGWLADAGTWDREVLGMLEGQYYERIPFTARLKFSGQQNLAYFPMERYTLRLNRHFDRLAYDVVNVTRVYTFRTHKSRTWLGTFDCESSYPYRLAKFDRRVVSLEDLDPTSGGMVFDGESWVHRPDTTTYLTQDIHLESGSDYVKYYILGADNYALVFPKGMVTSEILSAIDGVTSKNDLDIDEDRWVQIKSQLLLAVKDRLIEIVESAVSILHPVAEPTLVQLSNESSIDSASSGGNNLSKKEDIQQGNFLATMAWNRADKSDPFYAFGVAGDCGGGAYTASFKLTLKFRPELWNPRYGRNSLVNRYVTFDPTNKWLMDQMALDGFDHVGAPMEDPSQTLGYVAPGVRYRLSLTHLTQWKSDGRSSFPLALYYNGPVRTGSDGKWICDASLCARDESFRIDVLDPRPNDQVYNSSTWDILAKSCAGGSCNTTQIPSTAAGNQKFVWRIANIAARPDSMILDMGITRPTLGIETQYGLVEAPWPMRASWLDSVSRGDLVPSMGDGVHVNLAWRQGGSVHREAGYALLDTTPSLASDPMALDGISWSDTLRRDPLLPDSLKSYGAHLQMDWPSLKGGRVRAGSSSILTPQLSHALEVDVSGLPDSIGVAKGISSLNLVDLYFYRKSPKGAWDPSWSSRMDPVLAKLKDTDGDSSTTDEGDLARKATDPLVFQTDLDNDSLRGEDVPGALRGRLTPNLSQILSGIPFQISSLYPTDSLSAWVARNSGRLSMPTTWRLDAQGRLMSNPDVVVQAVNTRIAHIDGRSQNDVAFFNDRDLQLTQDPDQVYSIRLSPMSEPPSRRLVIEGRVPKGEYLLYALDPRSGAVTTIAHQPGADRGRDGLLGTLDVTRYNGAVTLVLAHRESDGNWTYAARNVQVGTYVSASLGGTVDGGFGRIEVFVEPGAFLRDTIVSITPIPRNALTLGAGSAIVEPRGWVIEVQPTPTKLQPGKKAIVTARFLRSEILQENGSISDLSLWYISDSGKLVELQNTTVVPTDSLVIISGETDHFSRFAALSKTRTYSGNLSVGSGSDRPWPTVSRDTIREIPVHAAPYAVVGVWETGARTPVRLGGTHCDAMGNGGVSITLPVGDHRLMIKVDSLCSGSVCSPISNSPTIRDSIRILPSGPGVLQGLVVSPSVFTPDNDGIDDSVAVSVVAPTSGTLFLNVVDSAGGLVAQRNCLVLNSGRASCSWDGRGDKSGAVRLGIFRVRVGFVDESGWATNQLEGDLVADTGRILIYDEQLGIDLPYGVGMDRTSGGDTSRYLANGSGWDGRTDTSVSFSGKRSLVIRSPGGDPVLASEGWTPTATRVPDSSAIVFAWRKSNVAARLAFLLSTGEGRMFEVAEAGTWFGRGLALPRETDTGWHQIAAGLHTLGWLGKFGRYDTAPAGRVARVEFGVKPVGTDASVWVDQAAFAKRGRFQYPVSGRWNPLQIGWKSAQDVSFPGNGITLSRRSEIDERDGSTWLRDTTHPGGRGWVMEVDTIGDWTGAELKVGLQSNDGVTASLPWSVSGLVDGPFDGSISDGKWVGISLGAFDPRFEDHATLQNIQLVLRTTGVPKLDTAWRRVGIQDWRIVLDTTPPVISVSGISDSQSTQGDVNPVVSFTDLHLQRTDISIDNKPWATGDLVKGEGEHLLVARATDLAGNSAATSVRFWIDRTPPLISIFSPREQESINTMVQVSGLVDDPSVRAVTVSGGLHDTELLVRDCMFHGLVPMEIKPTRILIQAKDAAGNQGSADVNVLVARSADTDTPSIRLDAPIPGEEVADPVEFRGRVTDAHLAYFKVGNDLVSTDAEGRFQTYIDLEPGRNTVVVSASDSAGHEVCDTISIKVRDAIPPAISQFHLERDSLNQFVASFVTDKAARARAYVKEATSDWMLVSTGKGAHFELPIGKWYSEARPMVRFEVESEWSVSRSYGPWAIPSGPRKLAVRPGGVDNFELDAAMSVARAGDTIELAPGIYHSTGRPVGDGVVLRGISMTECVVFVDSTLRMQNMSTLENMTLVSAAGETGVLVSDDAKVALRNVILRGFSTGVDVRGVGATLTATSVTSIHRRNGFHVAGLARGYFVHCLAWALPQDGDFRVGFLVDAEGAAEFDGCRSASDSSTGAGLSPIWLWRNGIRDGSSGFRTDGPARIASSNLRESLSNGTYAIRIGLDPQAQGVRAQIGVGVRPVTLPASLARRYRFLRFLMNRNWDTPHPQSPLVKISVHDDRVGPGIRGPIQLDKFVKGGIDDDQMTWQEVVVPFDSLGIDPSVMLSSGFSIDLCDATGGGQPDFMINDIALIPDWVSAHVLPAHAGIVDAPVKPVGMALIDEDLPRVEFQRHRSTWSIRVGSDNDSVWFLQNGARKLTMSDSSLSNGIYSAVFTSEQPVIMFLRRKGDSTSFVITDGGMPKNASISVQKPIDLPTPWISGCFTESDGRPLLVGACRWAMEVGSGDSLQEEIDRKPYFGGVLFLGPGQFSRADHISLPMGYKMVGSGWDRTWLPSVLGIDLDSGAGVIGLSVRSSSNLTRSLVRSNQGILAWDRFDLEQEDSALSGTGSLNRLTAHHGIWSLAAGRVDWVSTRHASWRLGHDVSLQGSIMDSSTVSATPTLLRDLALPDGQIPEIDVGRMVPIWDDPLTTIQHRTSPYTAIVDPSSGLLKRREFGSRIHPPTNQKAPFARFIDGREAIIHAPGWGPKVQLYCAIPGNEVNMQIDGSPAQVKLAQGFDSSVVNFWFDRLMEGEHLAKLWITGGLPGDTDYCDLRVSYLEDTVSGRGVGLIAGTDPRRSRLVPGELIPLKAWIDSGAGVLSDVSVDAEWTLLEGMSTIERDSGRSVLKSPEKEGSWVSLRAGWHGFMSGILRMQVVSSPDLDGPRILWAKYPSNGRGVPASNVEFNLLAWDQNGCEAFIEICGRRDSLVRLAVNGSGTPGEYWISSSLSFPEGRNQHVLVLRDSFGNETRSAANFLVDTTPPRISPINVPSDGNAWMGSMIVSGNVDGKDDRVLCSVRDSRGTRVDQQARADVNGYFSCAVQFPAGLSVLNLEAKDSLGNRAVWSSPIHRDISADRTAPIIRLPTQLNGKGSASSSIVVEGVVEEAYGIPTLTVDSAIVPLSPDGMGIWKYRTTLALVHEGSREFVFRAVDDAGNVGQASLRVVRDTTGPVISILSPNPVVREDASISGTVDDPSVLQLIARIDSNTWMNVPVAANRWSFSVGNLGSGEHVVTVEARDSLGNVGRSSRSFHRIAKDRIPPVLTLLEPLSNPDTVYSERATIRFRVQDDDLSEMWLGSQPIPISSTDCSLAVPLRLGSNFMRILALDSAGNRTDMVVQINRMDTVPPVFQSWSRRDSVVDDTLRQVFLGRTDKSTQAWLQVRLLDSLTRPYAAVLFSKGDSSHLHPLDTIPMDSLYILVDSGSIDSTTPVAYLERRQAMMDTVSILSDEIGETHTERVVLPNGYWFIWRWKAMDESGNMCFSRWDTVYRSRLDPKISILSGPYRTDTVRTAEVSWSLETIDDHPGVSVTANGFSIQIDSTREQDSSLGSTTTRSWMHWGAMLRPGQNHVVFRAVDADGDADSLMVDLVFDTSTTPTDQVVFDPIGDATGLVDFGEVHVAHSTDSIYFLIHFSGTPPRKFSGQSNSLYVDLDGNPGTGDAHGFDARWKIESLGQNGDGTGSWMQFEVWRNGYWNHIGGNASRPQSNPFVTFSFNFHQSSWTPDIVAAGDQILPSGRIAKADGGALELAIRAAHIDSIRWYLDGAGDAVGSAVHPNVYRARDLRHIDVDGRTVDWGVPPASQVKSVQAFTRTTSGDAGNQLRIEMSLRNTGTVELTGLVARYWFSVAEQPGAIPVLQGPYYAPFGESVRLVRGNAVPGFARLPTDVWAAEVSWPRKVLASGSLTQDPGGSALSFNVHLPNWADWIRTNDWTRNSTTAWASNERVTVTSDSVPLWGAAPIQPPATGTNLAPLATIHGLTVARIGERIVLDTGSTTDPDNGPLGLAFRWVLVERDSLLSRSASCTLSLPASGVWHIRLEVTDGDLSATATQAISVTEGTETKPLFELVPSSRSISFPAGASILRIPSSALGAIGWNYGNIRLQFSALDGKPLSGSLAWPGGIAAPSSWTWSTGLGKLPKTTHFTATLTLPVPRAYQVQWWAE